MGTDAPVRVWPTTIYLQRSEDCADEGCGIHDGETTWCVDQINDTDVEYVRKDAIKRCPMSCAWGIAGHPTRNEIGKCPRCDGAGFVVEG